MGFGRGLIGDTESGIWKDVRDENATWRGKELIYERELENKHNFFQIVMSSLLSLQLTLVYFCFS